MVVSWISGQERISPSTKPGETTTRSNEPATEKVEYTLFALERILWTPKRTIYCKAELSECQKIVSWNWPIPKRGKSLYRTVLLQGASCEVKLDFENAMTAISEMPGEAYEQLFRAATFDAQEGIQNLVYDAMKLFDLGGIKTSVLGENIWQIERTCLKPFRFMASGIICPFEIYESICRPRQDWTSGVHVHGFPCTEGGPHVTRAQRFPDAPALRA